jgi:hypothetical protein
MGVNRAVALFVAMVVSTAWQLQTHVHDVLADCLLDRLCAPSLLEGDRVMPSYLADGMFFTQYRFCR